MSCIVASSTLMLKQRNYNAPMLPLFETIKLPEDKYTGYVYMTSPPKFLTMFCNYYMGNNTTYTMYLCA